MYKAIAALAIDADWGNPTEYNLNISRKGSGFNDTEYTVTPKPNAKPLDELDVNEGEEVPSSQASKLNLKELIEKGNGNRNIFLLSEAMNSKKA